MTKSPHAPRMASARSEHALDHDRLLHERAIFCSRLARLLIAALAALDWQSLRFADRSRLARALTRLASDAHLAAQAAGGKVEQAEQESTKKLPCSTK